MIWNRDFELDIKYECYPGEKVLDNQKKVVNWIKNEKMIGETLDYVKQYVLQTADGLVESPIDNIFKYVMPKSIFVPHCKETSKFAIMCNYKFDMEHGIAVVFENGKYKEIGMQDIVL